MRTPLVMGNWKMNASFAQAKELCEAIRKRDTAGASEVVVFPPYPYISYVSDSLSGTAEVGAQNLNMHDNGAHTGEVSADMLKNLNCNYVLVGHSERRTLYGEGDEIVAAKTKAAVSRGLIAVLCVGETLPEREEGRVESVISKQLKVVFDRLSDADMCSLVIAYEPVWAIGTGKVATPDQVQVVHKFIRDYVAKYNSDLAKKIRIVYGGSLKSSNAAEVFALADVDGGLIGGASLIGEEFVKIICLSEKET